MLIKNLGPVEASLNDDAVHPGETLTSTVLFRPPAEIHLAEATFQLTALEKTVKGSGKNRRTISKTVHEDKTTQLTERRVMPDESVVLEGTVHLPQDAPCTLFLGSNSLPWKIGVHLNLRRSPDWRREFPVSVIP